MESTLYLKTKLESAGYQNHLAFGGAAGRGRLKIGLPA